MHTVVTYNGKTEDHKDCVFIRGKFYHKERDCYLYNGVYYSPHSRYIVLDHETRSKLHVLEARVDHGIVDFDGMKPIFGHFSSNISKNCLTLISESVLASSEKEISDKISELSDMVSSVTIVDQAAGIRGERNSTPISSITNSTHGARGVIKCIDFNLLKGKYIQSMNSDLIVPADRVNSEITKVVPRDLRTMTCAEPYSFNLAYNSELMMDLFSSFYEKNGDTISDETLIFKEFIESHPFTFGVEYESWDGRIPTYICAKTGLIPLRDGSLRHDNVCGFEYASVVMDGLKGFETIKKQCEALNNYCCFNESCSTHVHVGSIPKTEVNLINLYKGFQEIQESMFSLFPACLKDTSTYKQKSYCGPLPKIPLDSNSIVNFLSDGHDKYGKFGNPHPKDRTGQSKWNIQSRYHWINLCNFYYTKRGTVELRISTPTFNHSKVAALVVLTMSVVNAALNNRFYTCVFELINAEIESVKLKKWMVDYLSYRVKVLSKFDKLKTGGVSYHEKMTNDGSTGTESPLY